MLTVGNSASGKDKIVPRKQASRNLFVGTEGRPEHEELRLKLAREKTFARFRRELCKQLVYRGWWLTGCSLATFHLDLVAELPRRRPLRGEA